jgi:hypothetical protein
MENPYLQKKMRMPLSAETAASQSSSSQSISIFPSVVTNVASLGGTITLRLYTGERLRFTPTPARAAVSPLQPMAITTGNTAPTSATSRTGLEVIVMTDEQFKREALYQATMSMFQSMLRNRLITEEQYQVIDTKMKEKYRPIIGTLCSK